MSCRCGNNNCTCNGSCWGTSTWDHNHNHCGCSNIITTPCTASTGCLSTNYAKCITYSGTTLTGCIPLTNGENLDVSLGRIVDAVCALTPEDIAWNLFDYSCLGIPAPFSTAQEFAEGISAAHCALDVRVADIEQPVFPLCSLFTSGTYLITPGTTTIESILGYYAAILCDLNTNSPSNFSLSNSCLPAITSETTLNDYLQWLINGVCTVRGELLSLITTNTNNITAIRSYIGNISQTSSGHDNTDCLSGGSADSAYDTIELIKDKLCLLNSTVASIPDLSAISLSWAPCFYNNTPTSLTTQLGRMVSQLKLQNFQFSSDFTVTPAACGPTISLNTSLGFTCSDLAACSIHSLGDSDPTADSSGNTGGSWTWDNALGYYRSIRHVITVTTGGRLAATGPNPRGVEVIETDNADPANLSRNFAINFREEAWLDLTTFAGAYISPSSGSFIPMIMKTWDGQIRFRGTFTSNPSLTPMGIGATGQPLNNNAGIQLFASIPAAYRPTVTTTYMIPIGYPSDPGVQTSPNAAYIMGQIVFDASTGHIQLYTRNLDDLYTNIDGNGGTDAYLGNYTGSLAGLVINY